MTFSTDWEVLKSDAGLVVGLQSANPLVGSYSLEIHNDAIKSTVATSAATVRRVTSPAAFTSGRIRTLIRALDAAPAGTAEGLFGILCMMNGTDVISAGGKCYAAGYHNTGTPQWRLVRFDNGIGDTSTATNLETGDTTNTPAEDETHAIELEWNLDEDEFSGVNLIMRVGAEEDFSDLTEIYNHVDSTASHLAISSGEGLIFIDYEGGGDLKRVYYDKSRGFQLIATPT